VGIIAFYHKDTKTQAIFAKIARMSHKYAQINLEIISNNKTNSKTHAVIKNNNTHWSNRKISSDSKSFTKLY